MPTRRAKRNNTTCINDTHTAVIYLRVSTDEQRKHGYGIDAQYDDCLALIAQQGYTLVSTQRDEGISGTKGLSDRPGLAAAIGMLVSGDADVLVCAASDRLSRDVELSAHFRKAIINAGAKLHTVKEGVLSDSANTFMANIFAAVAQEEREKLAARLYGGRKQRSKRDGMGSGPLPWGYMYEVPSAIVIDQTAADTISKVLTTRDSGKSLTATATALNAAGYKTADGKEWTKETVRIVERHRELYATGKRTWDGIEASEQWPIIYHSGG